MHITVPRSGGGFRGEGARRGGISACDCGIWRGQRVCGRALGDDALPMATSIVN